VSLQVGAETFRLCRQLVDGVLLVDNPAISAAIKDVFNETRGILEPAGAVSVAGAKAWLKENGHKVGTAFADSSTHVWPCLSCTPHAKHFLMA
jgi:threonine dehydratase